MWIGQIPIIRSKILWDLWVNSKHREITVLIPDLVSIFALDVSQKLK